MSTRLCTLCRAITLSGLTSLSGYAHHASYEVLETSAEQCPLCRILHRALRQNKETSDAAREIDWQQQVFLGACDGGYVGLGIDRKLTNLDVHIGQEQCCRLRLYAGVGKGPCFWVIECVANTDKMIQRHCLVSLQGDVLKTSLILRPICSA